MSESAVFQGAAARRPATTKEMLPDRRSSEQRAVGVGRCAACLWRLPKCKGAALEERGEQRRRVAPHGARGASQRDAGSLWKNDRSRLAMRSDFLYSQIVLRGGSLETCSSRGIFRRTDKLHVGFRPKIM
jgi:hypothetical protein